MSNRVVIKEVDRESIYMEDCTLKRINWVKFLIGLVLSFGITLITVNMSIGLQTIFHNTFATYLYGTFILIMGFGMVGVAGVAGFFEDWYPAYEISITGDYGNVIYVRKTTPEQDEKEVCQATQRLEARAQEIAKNKREMELIATKCK